MQVNPPAGNVFANLEFKPAVAALLHAGSQKIIAEKLAIKAPDLPVTNSRSDGKYPKRLPKG